MSKPELDIAMELLSAETRKSAVQFSEAEELEKRAARLRETAPKIADRAIGKAARQLVTDYEAGLLDDRQSLQTMLTICQHKPSRVSWKGRPDAEIILQAFDNLHEPYTPVICYPSYGSDIPRVGITIGAAPRVSVSIARGMGGLPDAKIAFPLSDVRPKHAEAGAPTLDPKDCELSALHQMRKAVVGPIALQEYFANLEVHSQGYTCGHGIHTDANEILGLVSAANSLAEIADFELDTARIEADCTEAIARRRRHTFA